VTAIGRTWELWAHRYDNGTLRHVGARVWVELHQLAQPIVAVRVEEILDDSYAPEVTHYAWEDLERPRDKPAMVQIRAGSDSTNPNRALMLLDMCFPGGVRSAIDAGRGKVLALRITERVEAAQ
jgi:hypothetical protein